LVIPAGFEPATP